MAEASTKDKDPINSGVHVDSWENLFTGMGVAGIDKKQSTSIAAPVRLAESTLGNHYSGDGFCRKVVDKPATEMTREGFKIEGDTENVIIDYLDELHTKKEFTKALKWSRLYGGAIAILGIDDGGELIDEVNENGIRGIEFIRVYNRFRVSFSDTDLYEDPKDKKYGTPRLYTVTPRGGTSYQVHESRILVFQGDDSPDSVSTGDDNWGDSVVVSYYSQLRNLATAYNATADIINNFEETIISLQGLQDLVAEGNEAVVKKRLELMDLSRSTLRAILLDENEKFDKRASTVQGLAELLQEGYLALAAVSDIPVTVLMGQSAKGLSATGEGDRKQWYDRIASEQEDKLKPQLQRLIYLTQISLDGPTKGKEIENWSIEFLPLEQPSEKETAETRKLTAETDNLYVAMQVLHPTEVRTSRFGGDSYSSDTEIEDSLTLKPTTDPEGEGKIVKGDKTNAGND